MLCSNFHIHHCLLKDKKIVKIKTFPYLPTQKLKNKSETDLFISRPYQLKGTQSQSRIRNFVLVKIFDFSKVSCLK